MLALSAGSSALMQSPTAILEGTIVDSSGQVVPGAAVDLRDGATNQIRRTMSDDRGAFRFVALAPGTYDVGVQLEGFAPFQQQHLTLAIGATSQLTIRLAPAAISQTMTVTAQPPSLNLSQTSVATVESKSSPFAAGTISSSRCWLQASRERSRRLKPRRAPRFPTAALRSAACARAATR